MRRPELLTDRLRLAPLGIEHLPLLVELDSDQEVMRFILGRARTKAEAEGFWTAKCLETSGHDRGLGWWVGFVDDAFVGWWVLSPGSIESVSSDGSTTAETGWRLGRRWWGRGLATEGASAVLEWGFEHGGLETVWAAVDPENAGSRGVMRHVGMVQVEVPPDDMSETDELRYEISGARWRSRSPRAPGRE